MDDQRSAEGVEHLQAAARELLLAARSFLSVVEEVVEDRDRFAGAAAGVADLLRDGLAGAMPPSSPLQPWEQAAWAGPTTPDEDPDRADDGPSDPLSTGDDPDPAAAAATAAPAPAKKAPAKKAPAKKAPARKSPARKSPAKAASAKPAAAGATAAATTGDPGATAAGPPRRVRRIAVD